MFSENHLALLSSPPLRIVPVLRVSPPRPRLGRGNAGFLARRGRAEEIRVETSGEEVMLPGGRRKWRAPSRGNMNDT